MRRLALIAVALLAVPALAISVGGGDDAYEVRAVFDNAAFAAVGEEVKVAGATVGTIEEIELTDDQRAAMTLKIEDTRFTPFHADAHCTIRSEGLLAVKFIECDPGTSAEPELAAVEEGEGEGQVLLPVEQTTTPVDLDLALNTYREPTGRQLALLLSEFGAGVAGRGAELNEIIHRANPALRETDGVLKILAAQNRQLAQFATDADSVFSALASRQSELSGFVTAAAGTAQATAEESEAIAASIDRLPGFLRELRPALADLNELTIEGTPVLAQLGEAGADLSRAMQEVRPFTHEGVPAVRSLGTLADSAGPDLQRMMPLINASASLSEPLKPTAKKLGKISKSLKQKKARQRFLDLLYYGTAAVNGFDAEGHYARVELLSSVCSEYTAVGFNACDAQWGGVQDVTKPLPFSASAPASGGSPPQVPPDAKSATALLDYLLGDGK